MVNKKLTNRLARLIQRKPQVCFSWFSGLNSYNYLFLSKNFLVTQHKTYERKIDLAVSIDIFFAAISIRILPISCSNKVIRFSSSSIESREISSPTITSPAPATVNPSSLIRHPFCFISYFYSCLFKLWAIAIILTSVQNYLTINPYNR